LRNQADALLYGTQPFHLENDLKERKLFCRSGVQDALQFMDGLIADEKISACF
jgi:hypothetical protein